METNLFDFIINHNTITGCKTMTSIVLQISKIHYKLSEVCSLNYASPEPEPVLTHLRCQLIHNKRKESGGRSRKREEEGERGKEREAEGKERDGGRKRKF